MAGDETYEDFDFNDTDLAYAMGQGNRRKLTKAQRKEQATYGDWAEIDSDDEDRSARAAASSFFGAGSKKASYTTPVSFVSGGIKKGSGTAQEKEEDQDGEGRKEDEDEDVVHAIPKKRTRQAPQQREMGSFVFAGMRSSATKGATDTSGFADWTKKSGKGSVIMKMMQNMGYVPGKGLGADKQGIVEPVQAKVRPGRGALGAYGKEAQGPKFGESAADAQRRIDTGGDVEVVEEVAPKRESWKKSNAGRKVKYKTIDEVINDEGEGGGISIGGGSAVKIIDMTGPESRVYNDYNSFSKRTRAPEVETDRKKFDVPELMHNLNMLLDLTEDEIRRNDRHVRFLKDQSEVLKEDKTQLESKLTTEHDEMRRMEEVLAIVERFQQMSRSSSPTLEDCKMLFQQLRDDYAPEFQLFGLDTIALTNVLPMLKSYFATWDPLDPEQVDRGYDLLEEWEDILKINRNAMFEKADKDSLSAFDRCVWEAWMPPIRRAALAWNAKTNGPQMINVVETWISPRRAANPRVPDRPPLLPGWIIENLLEQVILPRIKEQVELWNPLTDHIPIDSWLLPWRPIMGDRLSPVYPPIRQKLARALRDWHPRDLSALAMLRPWNTVFSAGTMQSFLSMNIVPKLQLYLAGMDLNPMQNTQYVEFHTTIQWMELISADIVCQILVNSFFPRWYDNLCMWLEAPGRLMDEIKAYYQEWMGRFPDKLRAMKPIRDEFARALLAMDQSKRGLPVTRMAPAGPLMPAAAPAPSLIPPGFVRAPAPPPPLPAVSAPTSMRQLAEQWARERGIVFLPQPNKFYQGHPIYVFGSISIYFDGTAIWAFNPATGQWTPIALEELVNICR